MNMRSPFPAKSHRAPAHTLLLSESLLIFDVITPDSGTSATIWELLWKPLINSKLAQVPDLMSRTRKSEIHV
jgi:hypothetical protein